MPLPYNFTATSLGSLGLSPQLDNMGMIELHLSQVGIPEGQASLMLGLSEFQIPDQRKVQVETVNYLFGQVHYPGKVGPVGELQCTFVDYMNGGQRKVLHKWFDLIFNERTGLGAPIDSLKCDATVVLFSRDGSPRMVYELHGLFPTSDPPVPRVNYGNAGIVSLQMSFSVDWYEEKFTDVASAASAIGRAVFNGASAGGSLNGAAPV